jgi:hypothetical protein
MISCLGIGVLGKHAFSRQPDLGRLLIRLHHHLCRPILGEDEDWLHELSIEMFPEHGRLYVECGKDDALIAFTEDGIENLKQIVADLRADGRAPPRPSSPE